MPTSTQESDKDVVDAVVVFGTVVAVVGEVSLLVIVVVTVVLGMVVVVGGSVFRPALSINSKTIP